MLSFTGAADVENRQAIEMTMIYRDIINGTRELMSSVLDNRLNNVMKVLTSVTLEQNLIDKTQLFLCAELLDPPIHKGLQDRRLLCTYCNNYIPIKSSIIMEKKIKQEAGERHG